MDKNYRDLSKIRYFSDDIDTIYRYRTRYIVSSLVDRQSRWVSTERLSGNTGIKSDTFMTSRKANQSEII
jgi:hypothetical protein